MTHRPILKLPKGRLVNRTKGGKVVFPRPTSFTSERQSKKFKNIFEKLSDAFSSTDSEFALRQDPFGIAPERALVFETKSPIRDFFRIAKNVGLEVVEEIDNEHWNCDQFSDEEELGENAKPTLYATMPTLDSLKQLLRLWRKFQRGEEFEKGSKPWSELFSMLIDLRVWGPVDRLSNHSISVIKDRLPFDDTEEVKLELELWPIKSEDIIERWRTEVRNQVIELKGRIIDQSGITDGSFSYNAFLIGLNAWVVKDLLNEEKELNGLATIEGVQFIFPHTIAQVIPVNLSETENENSIEKFEKIDPDTPMHALLLDGTPIANHFALDGGVNIEDVFALDRFSQVKDRSHATAMASLILRSDLKTEETKIVPSRIVSIPVLVDSENNTNSYEDRLFVDVVHTALQRAHGDNDPLAPDAFLVNFSIGIRDSHFAGRISALARLIDWWSAKAGVLFVISAGNVLDGLRIPNMSVSQFKKLTLGERQNFTTKAIKNSRYERTLLAPAETMNGLTVGAASLDLSSPDSKIPDHSIEIHAYDEIVPAISSAVGLGAFKMIKPDVIAIGGKHEVVAYNDGDDIILRLIGNKRTGLNVASSGGGVTGITRDKGTSFAAAMISRFILRSIAELIGQDGPFDGEELSRHDLALLSRVIVVNSARWPSTAEKLYEFEKDQGNQWQNAVDEVSRYYGNGFVDQQLMLESPQFGVTLVGLGMIQKDQAIIFDLPLPPSLAGEKINRSLFVSLAWFSPVDSKRSKYRLATLEAISASSEINYAKEKDSQWKIGMKGGQPSLNQIKRGTVWSARFVSKTKTVPSYDSSETLPIRVQCKDASGGGLNQEEEIRFAVAVTLEIEENVTIDIYQEIKDRLKVQVRQT